MTEHEVRPVAGVSEITLLCSDEEFGRLRNELTHLGIDFKRSKTTSTAAHNRSSSGTRRTRLESIQQYLQREVEAKVPNFQQE